MALAIASSPHSVDDTVGRLLAGLKDRGTEVFAQVDHAGAARAAGLELADERVLIFGDPRVRTLLMQSDPAVGYELPLRMLVWDDGGETKIAYRPASDLQGSYAVAERAEVLEGINGLLAQLVAEAVATS